MTTFLIITETMPSAAMLQLFWKLLHKEGLRSEDCKIVALLGDEKPEGSYQKPTVTQLSRVMPLFRSIVEGIEAPFVIPCGSPAFRSITGLTWGIDSARGYVIRPDDCRPVNGKARVQIGEYKRPNAAKGISAGDPKFAMRLVALPPILPRGCEAIVASIPIETVVKTRFRTLTAFRAAFRNVRLLHQGEAPIDVDFQFTDGVPASGLDWSGVSSFDLECPFESHAIERASLAGRPGTYTFLWSTDAVRAVREMMAGSDLRVAHNQQFDIPILAAHGIEVQEPTFDTMLAASLLEPDLPKALDSVTPLYMLVSPWKHLSKERGFADPFYSAKDAFIEQRLGEVLKEKLSNLGMLDLFQNRMMPSIPVLQDMKQQGMKVCQKSASIFCGTLTEKINELGFAWSAVHPTVSPFSPMQVKKLLYDTWKLPIQRRKGDGISTDELALRTLQGIAPEKTDELGLLLNLRYNQKMLSSFGQGLIGKDRVHPSYLPAGKDSGEGQFGKGTTATGRLSCSNPNLQNQPHDARVLYVPDTSDHCFVEFDWSQAELRVAAALSGDARMHEALEGDIHGATMKQLGCERTPAKAVLYGSSYGAGPRKLREILQKEGLDVSEAECRSLQNSLARAYPTWWSWRFHVASIAASQKYLRNPFGRIRRFPLGENDVPAALDFIPQSVVGDLAWTLYRPMWELARSLGGRLTTVVHDSFLNQVPIDMRDRMMVEGRALLETIFPEVAPEFFIPVTTKIGAPGRSWGELEKAVA